MQLDVFAPVPSPVELRRTPIPEPAEVMASVGSYAHWQTLSLSQILLLWDSLYFNYIALLEQPIAHAKSFQHGGANHGKGGPAARQFYQREHARLVAGRQQLSGQAESLFCDNLARAITEGQAHLAAGGAEAETVGHSEDFFQQLFQHPTPEDLPKLLPVLLLDAAAEYARIISRDA